MKVNFWQALGVILILGGLIGMAWWHGYIGDRTSSPTPATTQPTP